MKPGFVPGWKGRDDVQRAIAATMPTLSEVAPRLLARSADFAADDSPILLYGAYRKVLGKDPDYPAQQIGDCVSFGHAHANDLTQCLEIALGEDAEYQETDTEVVYGFAREISGDLGRGDGSYGAAAVKGMMRWGMASRPMVDGVLGAGSGTYEGSRAKEYGLKGCPKPIKDAAKPFRLGAAALCDTYDEIVAALRNGYVVTECSDFLPGPSRDKDGFVRPSGRGGHCQCIVGVRFDRAGLCIINSWGSDYYSGPCGLDCPTFGYWLDREYVEKWICGSGDNWALSKSPAFEVKPWNWSVAA